jgi:hypothetical protein
MTREQLELLLREIGRVSGLAEVVLIGAQCVHVATDRPPGEVLMSIECEVLLDEDDPATRVIDDELGRSSPYVATHGLYADTVSSTFPYLPGGWEVRTRPLDAGGVVARCLEIHDLVISKLAAGRLKDYELVAALFMQRLAQIEVVRARIAAVADPHERALLLARLQMVAETVRT